jgi:hypothetical protein
LSRPIIADTGGLLRALARRPDDGRPSFPDYERALVEASLVLVPALVLAEVDYCLQGERRAMRKLVTEIFDHGTRYEYVLPLPSDIVRALELDAKFKDLELGLVDGGGSARGAARRLPCAHDGPTRFRRNTRGAAPLEGARALVLAVAFRG